MKKLKISLLLIISIMFIRLSGYSYFATVMKWGTPVYAGLQDNRITGRISPGTVVNVVNENEGYYRINYRQINGWTQTNNLVAYDNLFSNEKTRPVLAGRIFSNNKKNYVFYYKDGKFFKYNIDDRSVESYQKSSGFSSVWTGPKNNIFLMEGLNTNRLGVYNLQLYFFDSGKNVYLGSYALNFMKISSIAFSGGSQYLAILFNSSGRNELCVYKTLNGDLVATANDIESACWFDDMLVLNNKYYMWKFDPYQVGINSSADCLPERVLMRFENVRSAGAGNGEMTNINELVYINTGNGITVFNMKSKKSSVTSYKSLLFNKNGDLNFYRNGNLFYLKNVKSDSFYPDFQGINPKVEFLSFCFNDILGKIRTENKIDSLILYSENVREIYRYKAVDYPDAVGPNGLMAEILSDRDMELLIIEDPLKNIFFFQTI